MTRQSYLGTLGPPAIADIMCTWSMVVIKWWPKMWQWVLDGLWRGLLESVVLESCLEWAHLDDLEHCFEDSKTITLLMVGKEGRSLELSCGMMALPWARLKNITKLTTVWQQYRPGHTSDKGKGRHLWTLSLRVTIQVHIYNCQPQLLSQLCSILSNWKRIATARANGQIYKEKMGEKICALRRSKELMPLAGYLKAHFACCFRRQKL